MYFSHQIINIIQFKCKFSSIFTNVFLIYFFYQSCSPICVIKKRQHHPAWQTTIWWLVYDCAIDNGLIHVMSAIWTVTFLYFVDFFFDGFQFFPFTPEIKIYPGIEGFQYLPKCTYIVNLCMLWEEKWFSIFVTSEKTH